MALISSEHLRRFDWILLGSSMMLVLFGLAALYSTSLGTGHGLAAVEPSQDFSNFWKQASFVSLGILLMFGISTVNYRGLAGLSKVLYGISALLLIAVLLFGREIRGTTGWFGIGGFGLQPVEIVKLLLIIFLAKFFSDYTRDPVKIRSIAVSGLATAALVLLVLRQPDLGSAALLLSVWGGLLILSGIRIKHLIILGVSAVIVVVSVWFFGLQQYQRDRLTSFMDPSADPQGTGWNVTQSIIAIGSGGIFGKGLGYGSQSQLRFLPERQTDFVFAVIAEEFGFVGVTVLVVLYGVLFWRMFSLATVSRDDFTAFLVLGVMISIAVEVFVNLGGNLRLIPVTGVTLPFVSYGGSSLLVKFAMLGLLQSVAVRR